MVMRSGLVNPNTAGQTFASAPELL